VLPIRSFASLAMLTLAGTLVNAALGHAQNGPIKILKSHSAGDFNALGVDPTALVGNE
jgi:hypothetical protein